eukprot:s692_g17.t1
MSPSRGRKVTSPGVDRNAPPELFRVVSRIQRFRGARRFSVFAAPGVKLEDLAPQQLADFLSVELVAQDQKPPEALYRLNEFQEVSEMDCGQRLFYLINQTVTLRDAITQLHADVMGLAGIFIQLLRHLSESAWVWLLTHSHERAVHKVQSYFFRVMALSVDQHPCMKAVVRDAVLGGIETWKQMQVDLLALQWHGLAFGFYADPEGMDSSGALSRTWHDIDEACPRAEGLTQKSYRSYRRRLELFAKQCARRNRDTEIEGAYLAISLLQDTAWDATEQLDFDDVELDDQPFKPIFQLLDKLFQYEDLIEVPSRCEEFFQEFMRSKNEDMQAYILRHSTMMKRMEEVHIEVPKLLAGWHLLTRSGVPKWTHVQIKSMCGGDLEYNKVSQALMRMFGGDHRPNPKDLGRTSKDDAFFEDNLEDDVYYEDDDDFGYGDGYFDEFEEYDDEAYFEDEVPEEVENAADQVEDAYVNYVESRRRMRDIALSRGFYPVVALGPEFQNDKGKSGPQGKGKGKGKGPKGKGKGKGGGLRRTPWNRRPMSGLRRPGGGNSNGGSQSTASGNDFKSTLSGSTSQHGPRFKRYRVQGQGVKEVSEDHVSMVEDINTCSMPLDKLPETEECLFAGLGTGKAIVDSGASRTIVGEDVWKTWLDAMPAITAKEVETIPMTRDFRFGDGNVVRSSYEEWRVKQDYENGRLKIMDSEWFKPERDKKMHYILDLMERPRMTDSHAMVCVDETDFKEVLEDNEGIILVEEHVGDNWVIEPVLSHYNDEVTPGVILEVTVEEAMATADTVVEKSFGTRTLLFWELYVDRGHLASHLLEKYSDVTVATFSLPEWDFSKKSVRKEFLQLMRSEKPHFVWMAPPCTLWSTMQELNARTAEKRAKLEEDRQDAERSHLKFCKDVFEEADNIHAGSGIEHPQDAVSWGTQTWDEMDEYYDSICDRCRTGLVYIQNGEVIGKVKKSTRIRTNSFELATAMDLPCTCQPPDHVQMIGKGAALKNMQNYESGFVKIAAKAIYQNMETQWRLRSMADIMVTDEMNEEEVKEEHAMQKKPKLSEHEKRLTKEFGSVALRVVRKLHKQLGHPGNDRLVRALKDANFDESIIQCGRQFRCDTCESMAPRQLDKPSSLPQTTHFNDLLEMDVFHIKWRGDKMKILAVMDVHTKYEINEILKKETIAEEIAVLEKWMSWAGVPRRIRADSSGAHMGEEFQAWCDEFGIRLILVPKDAHNRMGSIERLHAVRRLQLLKMMKEDDVLEARKAVIIACSQRNRLRSIHGTSPAAMVLGYTPEDDGLCDEPSRIRPDGRSAYMEDQAVRILAAKAFFEANTSATLRQALLAKTRTDDSPLQVGDYGYYWRVVMAKEMSRWRGPALVCAVETRDGRPDVYWMAHGSSLVRVAHTMARREVPSERASRLQQFPDTAARAPTHKRVLQALQPVRGCHHEIHLPDKAEDEIVEKEAPKDVSEDSCGAKIEHEVKKPEAAATERERSRSPTRKAVHIDETRRKIAQESLDRARRLEGLPLRAATDQELQKH